MTLIPLITLIIAQFYCFSCTNILLYISSHSHLLQTINHYHSNKENFAYYIIIILNINAKVYEINIFRIFSIYCQTPASFRREIEDVMFSLWFSFDSPVNFKWPRTNEWKRRTGKFLMNKF